MHGLGNCCNQGDSTSSRCLFAGRWDFECYRDVSPVVRRFRIPVSPRRAISQLIPSSQTVMRLLFKVEDMFDISGRGCVIVPAIPEGLDFRIRAKDQIELRTPDGRRLETYIASIELVKPQDGSPCRMVIMLPRDITKPDVPTGTEVWFDQIQSFISKTVDIFRESPDASDDEIYCKTIAAGIKPADAARLVEFIPMAYCRLILTDTGARFSEMFQRRRHDGGLSHEKALAVEPLWTEIMSFARAEQGRGVAGRDFLTIAARSAEFDAVNQLLNRGFRPEDIALSNVVLKWPEEEPTP